MAYSTQADLVAAIGDERVRQLFDSAGAGTIDATCVAAAIETADAVIDSYASLRYSTPFATVPIAIKNLSVKLAIWSRKEDLGIAFTADELTLQGERVKWLESLANGKVTPGTDPVPLKPASRIDKAAERPVTKDVSREKTKGYW